MNNDFTDEQLDIIRRAIEFLKSSQWNKDNFAYDEYGNKIILRKLLTKDKIPCSCCMMGAIAYGTNDSYTKNYMHFMQIYEKFQKLVGEDPFVWNDEQSEKETVIAFMESLLDSSGAPE